MEEQIKEAYQKAASLKIKSMLYFVVFYFLITFVISIFIGSPFPYKESVLFISVRRPGWINSTYGLSLIFIIAVTAMLIAIFMATRHMINLLRSYVGILNDDCDAEKFSDYMNYALEYGKNHYKAAYQKILYQTFEQFYVMALIVNRHFESAEAFLKSDIKMKRKKKERLCRIIQLNRAYIEKDLDQFNMAYSNLDLRTRKDCIILAYNCYLKRNYKEALEYLSKDRGTNLYQKVVRTFRTAECYLALEEKQKARECLEFVIASGNTLSIKKEALELLNNISMK